MTSAGSTEFWSQRYGAWEEIGGEIGLTAPEGATPLLGGERLPRDGIAVLRVRSGT